MHYAEAHLHVSRYCDSYSRLPTILDLTDEMSRTDWLRLLGENWSVCDNIGRYKERLFLALGNRRTHLQMMSERERAELAALPDEFPIYRGCDETNQDGICWSLERESAAKFPFYNRYAAKRPVLVTAMVKRTRVTALKLDRSEAEIITFNARHARPKRVVETLTSSASLTDGAASGVPDLQQLMADALAQFTRDNPAVAHGGKGVKSGTPEATAYLEEVARMLNARLGLTPSRN